MNAKDSSPELVGLTVDIVSAYVANNTVVAGEVSGLIEQTFGALSGIAEKEAQPDGPELIPAIPVKKSITPEAVICLECGKGFKSLRRHLKTHHGLSPDEYRERWMLGDDYPIVAPDYAATRSAVAKKIGLGRNR